MVTNVFLLQGIPRKQPVWNGSPGTEAKHLKHFLSRPMHKLKLEVWKARVQMCKCARERAASYEEDCLVMKEQLKTVVLSSKVLKNAWRSEGWDAHREC